MSHWWSEFISFTLGETHVSIPWIPQFAWVWIEILLILGLILLYTYRKNSSGMVLFDSIFEKVYAFFEEILWEETKSWVKNFVTTLFFVILFSNLLGLMIEFIAPIFGTNEEGHLLLEWFIWSPTTDLNFNIGMAIIGVLVVLVMQAKSLWIWGFIHDYFPIMGKGYLPYEKGKLPPVIDYPAWAIIKVFDIILSLFLWLLEVIWTLAKIVSLSFRLFGNMTSGATLIVMLYVALGWITAGIVWLQLPLWVPILIYLQELLVSLIQAFVFPLLIAIFVKVAITHD